MLCCLWNLLKPNEEILLVSSCNIFPMACARNLPPLIRNLELSCSVIDVTAMVSHSTRGGGKKKKDERFKNVWWLALWLRLSAVTFPHGSFVAGTAGVQPPPHFTPGSVSYSLRPLPLCTFPREAYPRSLWNALQMGGNPDLKADTSFMFSSCHNWIPEIFLRKGEEKGKRRKRKRRKTN